MATREWTQKKETFKPEKNYFEITYEKVLRETSEEEDRLERFSERFSTWGIILGVLFTLVALFGGIALSALELWLAFWIVFPICIIGLVVSISVLLAKSQQYETILDKYIKDNDVWNTPEVQEIKRHNKEQHEFATKWRAEHPLEEKIRACLIDPKSSVDVANLARYYAEVYLKEKEIAEKYDA